MKRSVNNCIRRTNNKFNNHNRLFSTAFDPWHYLHSDTVKKEQCESFRKVWNSDIGNFKQLLTAKEIESFESRVAQTGCFDEFYFKMKELFSPRRHDAIRYTRTWQLTYSEIMKYNNSMSNNEGLINIIFGTDEIFMNEFENKYLQDSSEKTNLLSDFVLSDLRYMCSLQAINIYGGPSITAVFGCRNNYHFNIPNPNCHSAYWLNCLYSDKQTVHDIVLISVLSAIKENMQINQLYFKHKLQSLEQNAIKDEEWREYAKEFMAMDTLTFNDKLDRAFVAFQTDSGVSELRPRFHSDID